MSTESEFLELIRADLENPVPRLVLADWLDEQGDPRGEFIRVQCELESPGLSALKRRWLRQRERELLEDHEADWLESIAPKKLRAAQWSFRRGFVEEVAMDAKTFIEKGDFLHWAFPLLHVLHLRNVTPGLVEPLASCPALERIDGLRFTADLGRGEAWEYRWDYGDALHGSPIQRFLCSSHLDNLRSLNLADGSFGDEEIREVLACANLNLHSLDLSHNRIMPTGIRLGLDTFQLLAAASCTRDLQELSLRSNGLSINHVLILTYSHQLGNLEFLDLAGNHLGSQSNMIALVGLERFPRLKRLNLQSCGVGDAGINALLKTPLWRQLESLILWNNDITDRGLIAIAESEPPLQLRALELRRNALSDAGLVALAASPVLASFAELRLEHNRIEDAGVGELARSEHADRLRELHLRGNAGMGDAGGIALASAGFPALEVLDLAGTGVGDAAALALAESPASAQLRVLDLGGTRLTERGALALAESQFLNSLEFLDLRMNHLTGPFVTALGERFGNRVLA